MVGWKIGAERSWRYSRKTSCWVEDGKMCRARDAALAYSSRSIKERG